MFDGNFRFDVPEGIRMRVKEERGALVIEEEVLEGNGILDLPMG